MNRLCLSYTLIIALVSVISLSHQLSIKNEGELINFYSSVLEKLDEMKKSNAEHVESFRKELSQQSAAIQQLSSTVQQLKCKQEGTETLESEDDRGSLIKNIGNLVDVVEQLRQKQSKVEEALNKNIHSMRILIDSSTLNLGEMLMSAIKNGDLNHVIFLLELGAPIEYQDSERNRPIHIAVNYRQIPILEVLLERKAAIDSKGKNDLTALHRAGYNNCVDCARILIDKGASIKSRDQWGNTPMVHPARAGHKAFIELLLEKGADINETQSVGISGLHWAARDGRLDIAKYLISKGANPYLKALSGKTPLDEAVDHNHVEVANYLRSVMNKSTR